MGLLDEIWRGNSFINDVPLRNDIARLEEFILRNFGGNRFQVNSMVNRDMSRYEVQHLLKSGVYRNGTGAVVRQMRTSGCHENIVALVKKHPKYVAWTGLALSDDGIWRIHSWVTDERLRIIETATPRIKYFGFAFKLPK